MTAHQGASRASTRCALQGNKVATAARAKIAARIIIASFVPAT